MTRGREHLSAAVGALAPVVPALVVVAVLAWWTADGGGYAPADWLLGGLAIVGTAIAVVAGRGAAVRPVSRAARLAAGALCAYLAWSLASIAWSEAPWLALEGSARTLVYVAVCCVLGMTAWRTRSAEAVLALWVVAVTAVAVATLVRLLGDASLDLLIDGRLAEPTGYPNAAAALWTTAALPAIALAARQGRHPLARGLALGAATLLLSLALLGQSRGWLFTLPAVLLVALAVQPQRLRVALWSLPVAIGVLLALPVLLDVFDAATGPGLADALSRAVGRIALCSIAVAVVVAAAQAAGAARLLPDGVRRRARAVGVALAAGALTAALGAGMIATDGHPRERLDTAWHDFTQLRAEPATGGSRFGGGLGGNRYDFWRVAVDEWRDHLLTGTGQDNFAAAYVRERRSYEEPRWTHSLPLRVLSGTGVVGLLLLLVALAAAAFAALRRGDPHERRVAAALVLPAVVWLAQGSVDWLWEFPALSGAALGFVAVGLAVRAPGDVARPPALGARLRVVIAALAATAALGLLGILYLAQRDTDRAATETRPALALSRLDRAADLNPFALRPLLIAGTIALRAGDARRAQGYFARAADRDPSDWLARFELGLAAGAARDGRTAARALAEAERRNPRELLIEDAIKRQRRGQPMPQVYADTEFARRVRARIGG